LRTNLLNVAFNAWYKNYYPNLKTDREAIKVYEPAYQILYTLIQAL